jgi:outer membrane protein insertion porin family
MRFRFLAVLLLAVPLSVFAQAPVLTGTLREVRIEGATTNQDLIRTYLVSRPGIPVQQINLEAERNQVYSLGFYSEVTVSLEDRGNGPLLIVRVRENPRIAEVRVEGVESANPEAIRRVLRDRHFLQSGSILNTRQVEAGINTIQQGYSQDLRFPFEVPVSVSVAPQELPEGEVVTDDTPVVVTYTVNESQPVREVTFEGATVFDEATLQEIFANFRRIGTFDAQAYQAAIQAVADRYEAQGFRSSGVNQQATRLVDGVLNVNIREWRISALDTTAIGIDPSEFSLQPGDLYNQEILLEDIRRISRGRTSDISVNILPLSAGLVRVTLSATAPDTAGEISDIVIQGNTVIPTEELLPLLRLEPGDTFTSAVAVEDFLDIARFYRDRGYFIDTAPERSHFSYIDGTYTIQIDELRVIDYTVTFEGDVQRTNPTVVTRYLPDAGTVFNENRLLDGLRTIARLGVVEPVTFAIQPTEDPSEAVVNVVVRERQTRTFSPSAEYTTADGGRFSASLSYNDSNLWGEAHNFSAEVSASTSDIGFLLGGSLSYTIPWLYIDALDFQEVPTSVSASIFSTVATNQPMTADGSLSRPHPCVEAGTCDPDDNRNRVAIGEYTSRDTGLGFSVGRRVFQDTTLRLSARTAYISYILEPSIPCVLVPAPDGGLQVSRPCTLPSEEAEQFLPQSGWSAFLGSNLIFDNRDNPDFPTAGNFATANLGFGFGNDFRVQTGTDPEGNPVFEQRGYSYIPFELGGRAYLPLQNLVPELDDPNHVFAFRVNLGHQFGGEYPVTRFFRIGETLSDATLVRGYRRQDFDPSRTYFTSSVEYRYDFGFSTVATETVIAVVFADVGWSSSVPGFEDYRTPLRASAGIGLQVNLGFTALGYFPLRFDYGFSQTNPRGVFSFRIGPVF